jgi:hypothetical protein
MFERGDIALHFAHGGLVVLLDGHAKQLTGVPESAADAVERADDLVEPGALAAELLRPVGSVPDRRIFQLAAYFREAVTLGVVFKETSGAPRCAR